MNKDKVQPPGHPGSKPSRGTNTEPPARSGRGAKSAAPAPSAAKPAPAAPAKPPRDAQEVWEQLLEATKNRYSLATSLQRTRPRKLDRTSLHLTVTSELFLKKLQETSVRETIEAECQKLLGRKVAVELTLAEADGEDVFEGALKTFEGAEVHDG